MRSARKVLSLVGFISCLAGACLLFVASLPALSQELRGDTPEHQGAVYVGSESCFTCHEDLQFAWSGPLLPRQIDNLVVNPQRGHTPAGGMIPISSTVDSLPMRTLHAEVAYLSDDWYADPSTQPFTFAVSKEETLP